ncbi:MAG: hypothetical protein JRN20_16945 [Nitrososphaerota archaeon]|nr:hypothetical protein [Nitrososphaerota archaeon]
MPDNDAHSIDRKAALREAICAVEDRKFVITLLVFSNGCFITISEDMEPRLGAITVSIRSGGRSVSSPLIPESKGAMLASMVGEMLAESMHGMAITSLYLRKEVGASDMKTLISEVRKLVEKG